MLGMSKYPQEYIDFCKAQIDAQLKAYRKLAKASDGNGALTEFEPQFFNHMVLALEQYFCHRLRTVEGKDGNPLNESRVLSTSIMSHGGVMTADKTIKMKPENTLLGYGYDDQIALTDKEFAKLAGGFFAELQKKFT
jgi:hypothetical protein